MATFEEIMRTVALIMIGIFWSGSLLSAQSFIESTSSEPAAEVHLSFSIDRRVANVGESLVATVELIATPIDEQDAQALRDAVANYQIRLPSDDFDIIRAYRPEERIKSVSIYDRRETRRSEDVLILRKRFVVRPKTAGVLQLPGISIDVRGRTMTSESHQLNAYQIEGDFLAAQRAIMPLVVESRLDGDVDRRFIGTGSSFLVAENAIVTAYHVIVNAHRITATLPNGRSVRLGKVWAVDTDRDIAVLYINPKDVRRAKIQPLKIAPRESVARRLHADDKDRVVFTAGWPKGIQHTGAGILFRTDQYYEDDAIWLSSNRVRPGDSGGPLLDRQGRVLGVVSHGMSARSDRAPILENVSTATDPRPALVNRRLVERPFSLRTLRNRTFFENHPQARAVKIMSLLTEFANPSRHRDSEIVGPFLDQLHTAIEERDDVTRLHFLEGSIYQMLGDFHQATDSYERALGQRTEHFPAAYSLAYCYLALRSYETAVDLFDFTAQFEPYRDLAEYGLAQARLQILQYDEAIYHLRRVIHQHPEFAPAFYLLGRAYLGKDDQLAAAQILAKLEGLSRPWAALLEKSMRIVPFRPVVRKEMPRGNIRTLH